MPSDRQGKVLGLNFGGLAAVLSVKFFYGKKTAVGKTKAILSRKIECSMAAQTARFPHYLW